MNSTDSGRARRTRLPRSVARLALMGQEIERRWAERAYRPGAFPRLAAEALRAASYHEEFDEDTVAAWVQRARSLPRQLDPRSSFGQPPLTVWHGERFVVDLYFWVDTETSIHDHSFSGAFTNLSGHSLNCSYRFERPEEVGRGVLTGSLELDEATYLRPGDVCPIVAGQKFIHRVWHLDCPTVTLVARTAGGGPRRRRQYTYFPEGLAVEYRSAPPIEFQRRREFLSYLFRRRHPRRMELAGEVLTGADAWERCVFLGDVAAHNAKDEDAAAHEVDELVARLPRDCRPWLDTALAAARASADPLASVNWSRLRRTEHRLLVSLLNTYAERRPLLDWLARHGHAAAGGWREQLTRWLSEMDEDKAIRLRLGGARREIIAQLLRGRSDATALRELGRTYAITDAEAELLRQGFKRFRAIPCLKPLLGPRGAAGPAAVGGARGPASL